MVSSVITFAIYIQNFRAVGSVYCGNKVLYNKKIWTNVLIVLFSLVSSVATSVNV